MVTINLGNSAGSTANASYTLSDGCNDSIIDGMIPSVEWMTATASNGTISITATEDNPTTSERSGYITPLINGESCTSNRFKVTQEAGEEPEPPDPPTPGACTKFIVDGGSIDAEKEGDEGCDSAYLYGNPTAVYSPSTASSWVHISFIYYDTDPRRCCTDYRRFPEVAYRMQDEAGVPHDLNDHNLGTVRYTIDANGNDEDRSCEVWFIVDDVECTSKKYIITQSGGGGGGCTCSGLNIKSAISFGADGGSQTIGYTPSDCSVSVSSKPEWVTVTDNGNGTFTATVEKNTGGRKEGAIKWSVDGSDAGCPSTDVSQEESGGGGGCTCSGLNIKSSISFGADGGSQTIGYTPSDCSVSVYSKPEWVTVTDNGNGTFTAKAEKNTGGRKEGAIKWSVDGSDAGCPSTDVSQEGGKTYSFEFEYYEDENGPDVYGDYVLTTGYKITNFKINGQTASPSAEVYYSLEYYSTNCTVTSRTNFTGGTSNSTTYNHNEASAHCTGSKLHCKGFKVSYNGTVLEQKQAQDEELNGTYSGTF